MYYLVQSNIYSDPEHHRIFDVLEDMGLPYESIELNGAIDVDVLQSDRKDIFVYGSVKLARLAKKHEDWTPGSFYGGNHAFEVYSQHYKEHLLNYGAKVFKFGESLDWQPGESKFIKPYRDAKVFTGRVFTEPEWKDFVLESLAAPKTDMLHMETQTQASRPQKLIKEARTWIVGGKMICGVYYQHHGDVPFEKALPKEAEEFVQEMTGIFNVAEAFVMDIGLTNDGWKIVEVNCINSAGFYKANAKTIFRALEAYF